MTVGDLVWGGDVDQGRAGGDHVAHRVGDPAGVGDRGVDHVGGDAERGQFQRGGHRVVDLGGLGGAVGDLLGEAEVAARGQADDAAPVRAAARYAVGRTRRSSAPGPSRRPRTAWSSRPRSPARSDRPSRSVSAAANESASQPVALLTRMSTGPSCCSARSNSDRRGGRIGQVGFDGDGPAARRDDLAQDRAGVALAAVAIGLRSAGIGWIDHPEVGADHRAPLPRQRPRGGRPDPVIGPGHDRHVVGCHLASLLKAARACFAHVDPGVDAMFLKFRDCVMVREERRPSSSCAVCAVDPAL